MTLNLRQIARKDDTKQSGAPDVSTSSESSGETGSFHTAASQGPTTDWLALAQSIVNPPHPLESPHGQGEGLSDSGVGLLNGSPSHSSASSEHETWQNKTQEEMEVQPVDINDKDQSNTDRCVEAVEMQHVTGKVNHMVNGHSKDSFVKESNTQLNSKTKLVNGDAVICKDNAENVPEHKNKVRIIP